ncbi:MAG TPA: FtsX-like permease family protein [Mycobacteriales bacterium]|nr:FtsX-like permease family protein [Mycobacteriales bacterium]
MGSFLLVCRLGMRDLRHRPAQAILLLIAISAGAATLTLSLAVHGTTDSPYARTRAATNGPDVVATVFQGGSPAGPVASATPGVSNPTAGNDQANAAALAPLTDAPGVVAHSGPFPVTWRLLRTGRTTGSAEVEGRSATTASVDQPRLLQGSWVRPGGVVVEAGFASALDVHVGSLLNLGSISFRVVGTAVTAAIPSYPNTCGQAEGCFLANGVASHDPGLVWATQADVMQLTGTFGPDAYFLNLKLRDAAVAPTFVNRYNASNSPTAPVLVSWQNIQDGDAQTLAKIRTVLLTGSWFLALLALASVTVLVGGRMAEQTRRVGLLKAVGGTPWLVAAVLLFEHVVVGLCAALVGLVVGWLAAPLIDGPAAGLLGAAGAPSVTGTTVAFVAALALGVAIIATLVPAVRAARQSTVAALNDSAPRPRRREWVIRFSTRLPAPLLLGTRLLARRPRRLLLSVLSIAVTTSGLVLVAILIQHATATGWPLGPRLADATTIISVMLVVLAAVNAVFIAWTTALDVRHSAALAQALGATPGQITAGLSGAQLVPALLGALLGIPGGIGIYAAVKSGPGTMTLPSALWFLALIVLTLLVIAVLTTIATRIGARRPVAEVLQAEAA